MPKLSHITHFDSSQVEKTFPQDLQQRTVQLQTQVMREPVFEVPTRSDTDQAVQLQKMVRGLKFWIKEVEGLFYPYSKYKGTDQMRCQRS